jgi:hypothetical protein
LESICTTEFAKQGVANVKRYGLSVSLFLILNAAASTQTHYSNVTNFTGFVVFPDNVGQLGGVDTTLLIADDITASVPSDPAAFLIGRIVFTMGNGNPAAISFRPQVRFWDNDGPGGGPGTFLGGLNFNPVLINASSVSLVGFTSSTGIFYMPADGTFWAGIQFDNGGASTANAAQLGLVGPGTFNPPTIGSSQDLDFLTDTLSVNTSNNPTGTIRNSPFGGTPVASYGWQFIAVPEPTTWALIGIGGLAIIPAWRRWRRHRAGVADAAAQYDGDE